MTKTTQQKSATPRKKQRSGKPASVKRGAVAVSSSDWVGALMDGVAGTKTFDGLDTGTIKLPSGGKCRMVIGTISISTESE